MSNTIIGFERRRGRRGGHRGLLAPRPWAGRSPRAPTRDTRWWPSARLPYRCRAWLFHQVPEGKTVKNQLHLDLAATDWEAEIGRLTDLGRYPDPRRPGERRRWITLADPEGNEFDLVRG